MTYAYIGISRPRPIFRREARRPLLVPRLLVLLLLMIVAV